MDASWVRGSCRTGWTLFSWTPRQPSGKCSSRSPSCTTSGRCQTDGAPYLWTAEQRLAYPARDHPRRGYGNLSYSLAERRSTLNWKVARRACFLRDEGNCQRCLRPATDAHHRKVKGMGGTGDEETKYGLANLVSLCRPCHNYIHAHPAESYELGWLVHSWQDPSEVQFKNPDVPKF